MPDPQDVFEECVSCSHRRCERAPVFQLDICEFGISFVNDGERIQRKHGTFTLRHISQNLRHELNKTLQVIISEACAIDGTVTTKQIIPSNPASTIVGAA